METTTKTYRIFADIDYLQPKFDDYGFPDNPPLLNHDPQITILSQDMGELMAEVSATDEQELHTRLNQLKTQNRNLALITLRDGDQGVVEL